jgi:GNAT superfamily N-acetyltransferase
VTEGARRAVAADLTRLAELARDAIAELAPSKGGSVWAVREARPEPVEEGLALALSAPNHCVLVGTIDDAVVGYAAVHVEALHDGRALAVLTDLYVEPGAREVGIGEALIDGVVEWARGEQCMGIDSLVLPGNRESKNFFETFGLVARAIVVHRALGGDDR